MQDDTGRAGGLAGASTPEPTAAAGDRVDPAITDLLHAWRGGDADAVRVLLGHVYQRLHRIAEGALRGERHEHTLRATALLHEAFLRLTGGALPAWRDRAHFFALAARTMRRILIDHARARAAERRGGPLAQVLPLDDAIATLAAAEGDPLELLALDRALEALARHDARKARVVELRCFLGLSVAETATLLAVSEPTVILDLRLARAWLAQRLSPPEPVHG